MSWNWLTGFLNFEESPPEPLVLGAELWCPYGSEHTYLILERDGFDIGNLPQANVDDCKKSVNIFPFGECAGGRLCEYKMKLARKWENPEPQTEIVNGKEVITTKSVLMCNAEGMEIQAATSGQEFGKSIAEQLNLKAEMDAKYPGLYDLLMDPYGSLYLNEGMYEKALAFLEDQVQEKGNIFLPAIFDGDDLKNEMVRLALGRLMPRCDVSTYDRFINGLEDTGVLIGMNEKEGWDVHYLNDEMMEMLWKDCKTTDERVKTDPVIRWQEENRVFTSSMSDAMTQLSKAVVMYLVMQAEPAEKTGENPLGKVKEKLLDKVKQKPEELANVSAEESLADLMSPEDAERYLRFLKNGSTAGLTPEELAGIQKVDDYLLTNSSAYSKVMELRSIERSLANERAFNYYKDLASRLDVSTAPNTAVFYSGPGNREVAEAFAKMNEKVTLEMTKGGKFLDDLELFNSETSPLTSAQAIDVWAGLSERYAQQASGNTYGFVNGARPDSIFNTYEYPALQNNSNVTNVFTELLQGGL